MYNIYEQTLKNAIALSGNQKSSQLAQILFLVAPGKRATVSVNP